MWQRPGQGRRQGTLFSCRQRKGHPRSIPGFGSRTNLEGSLAQRTSPRPPQDTVTDFCIKADQQVHCPSAPDHHLRAISAPCILFFKLWPEGTLGTRTSDVSSFPPTDKPLCVVGGLPQAVGLLSAQ